MGGEARPDDARPRWAWCSLLVTRGEVWGGDAWVGLSRFLTSEVSEQPSSRLCSVCVIQLTADSDRNDTQSKSDSLFIPYMYVPQYQSNATSLHTIIIYIHTCTDVYVHTYTIVQCIPYV